MHKHGLGKGLGSLIPKKIDHSVLPETSPVKAGLHDQVLPINVDLITPNPHQPRTHFAPEGLEELASSIRQHGIFQPLIARQIGNRYELIAGERRWRAAKMVGLKTVPVIVRAAREQEQLELALLENIQRRDLNPLEEAVAYKRLIDEFSLTQEELSSRIGKSRPVIANTLRLLQLPQEIQRALSHGVISYSTARIIAGLPDQDQLPFFYKIQPGGLSVKEIDDAAKKVFVRHHVRRVKHPHYTAVEERLQQSLGTKVAIKKTGSGGQIAIHFYSDEELDNLARKLLPPA